MEAMRQQQNEQVKLMQQQMLNLVQQQQQYQQQQQQQFDYDATTSDYDEPTAATTISGFASFPSKEELAML